MIGARQMMTRTPLRSSQPTGPVASSQMLPMRRTHCRANVPERAASIGPLNRNGQVVKGDERPKELDQGDRLVETHETNRIREESSDRSAELH